MDVEVSVRDDIVDGDRWQASDVDAVDMPSLNVAFVGVADHSLTEDERGLVDSSDARRFADDAAEYLLRTFPTDSVNVLVPSAEVTNILNTDDLTAGIVYQKLAKGAQDVAESAAGSEEDTLTAYSLSSGGRASLDTISNVDVAVTVVPETGVFNDEDQEGEAPTFAGESTFGVLAMVGTRRLPPTR